MKYTLNKSNINTIILTILALIILIIYILIRISMWLLNKFFYLKSII